MMPAAARIVLGHAEFREERRVDRGLRAGLEGGDRRGRRY